LTAASDFNLSLGFAGVSTAGFDSLQEFLSLDDFTEDDVLSIEPRAFNESQEELRAVGVGTGIGHGQKTRSGVLNIEVFILEFSTIDGFTTSTVASSEITTLSHELGDDSVENVVQEVKGLATLAFTLFTSAESSEVFSSLGDLVSEEFEFEPANSFTLDADVEIDDRVLGFLSFSHFEMLELSG